MSQKKSRAARLAVEARRRARSIAARAEAERLAAAAVVEARLAAIRATLSEAAARHRAERLLREAMAVTDRFAWKPWGYEVAAPPRVAGLSVLHLRVRPEPVRATPLRRLRVPTRVAGLARSRFSDAARLLAVA